MTRGRGFTAPAVFDAERPLVFAHRGGAGLGPENTLPAFARGLAAGADGIECDVRLSADGVPVVIHDATLDRTTDRQGPVAALTAVELAAVDAACGFQPPPDVAVASARAGVSSFAEVLDAFPAARVIVEVKDGTAAAGRAVAAVVRRAAAVHRVCVGSFHPAALDAVRREAPEIATGASLPEARALLYRSFLRLPRFRRVPFVALQVPEAAGWLKVTSPAFMRQAHREHCLVQVWTVDHPDAVRRLLGWGADGVVTDRPDRVVPARDAWVAGL